MKTQRYQMSSIYKMIILVCVGWSLAGTPVQADWQVLSDQGMNYPVYDLAVGSNNTLYAAGEFTEAGGVAANRVARWNGTAWSAMSTGLGDTGDIVYALVYGGTTLYAGGTFTNHVASWNGTTWQTLGSNLDGNVLALAYGGGTLYAGGSFTNEVASWTGSTWQALGTGPGDVAVNALVYGSDGKLYAGDAAGRVAYWTGSAWQALGAGMNSEVRALVYGNGTLYAGGAFTVAGSVSAYYIAQWPVKNAYFLWSR